MVGAAGEFLLLPNAECTTRELGKKQSEEYKEQTVMGGGGVERDERGGGLKRFWLRIDKAPHHHTTSVWACWSPSISI